MYKQGQQSTQIVHVQKTNNKKQKGNTQVDRGAGLKKKSVD